MRVAILISGGGSNMETLVRDMSDPGHGGTPVVVVSNVPDAGGLTRARARDIPTATVDHRAFPDRPAFEVALAQALEPYQPDVICLAGFMRILTGDFVARWPMLNIHPSLLPKYPGLNTHARALEAGDAEAGCTVHRVTPQLDAGPILGQGRVPIRDGDTAETLAARVLNMEHDLYPKVLRRFVSGHKTPLYLPA